MVKYTLAASVALIQLAMLAQTSVALPIEYAEGLESRAISSPNGQQLAERDDMELEARVTPQPPKKSHKGRILLGAAAAAFAAVHYGPKVVDYIKGKFSQQPQGDQGDQPPEDQQSPQTQRRDLSHIDLDARDWDEFEKRDFNDALDRRNLATFWQNAKQMFTTPAAQQQAPNSRRDLSDLYGRDWDEYEKRDFNDFEERDWNEFEERDWDDYELEARGLDFDELDELD